MEQAKHTPGPWVQMGSSVGVTHGEIASVWEIDGRSFANARIISASPDLFEALQMARAYIASRCGTPDPEDRFADQVLIQVHRLMDDAIAKATGANQ